MPGIDDAFRFQNDASSFVRNEIQRVLEEILDKYDQPGKIIRIEKLELDIRDITFEPGELPTLTQTFRAKLEEQLTQQLHAAKQKNHPHATEPNLIIYDEAEDILELLLSYLATGHLPWWAAHYQDIDAQATFKKLFATQRENLILGIRKKLSAARFRARLVKNTEQNDLQALIPDLFKVPVQFQKTMLYAVSFITERQDLLLVLDRMAQAAQSQNVDWQTLFAQLFDQSKQNPAFSERELLAATRASNEDAKLAILAIAAMKRISAEEKTKILLPFLGKHKLIETQEAIQTLIETASTNTRFPKESISASNEEAGLIEALAKLNHTEPAADSENHIPVQQAGLVILQPYLLSFFEALNLLKGKFFISEKEQHHAVYILHFIATGEIAIPEEHQLVLHKVLCGLEVEEVLHDHVGFTEQEKTETEKLLESVIENWAALKNTSPQGLRAMFLKRPGNLRLEANGWNLRIERETHDILLDKLPWGISLLKAPWNDRMIYVEW